jgi:hypothetical protein
LKLVAVLAALVTLSACAHAAGERSVAPLAVQLRGAAFTLRYGPADAEVAEQVTRLLRSALTAAERWGTLPSPVVITIHPTHDALEQAVRREGNPWLRAWARHGSIDLQSPRSWSQGTASDSELTQILTHELTHCVMFQAIGRGNRVARGIPLWFREGMASTTAGARHAEPRADELAELNGDAPPGERRADDPLRAAALRYRADAPPAMYGTADRAFRFLLGRYGERCVLRILERLRDGDDFAAAFESATRASLHDSQAAFRERLVEEVRG